MSGVIDSRWNNHPSYFAAILIYFYGPKLYNNFKVKSGGSDPRQGSGTGMSTKERIRTIRLLEKLAGNPVYAQVLGIEAVCLIL